MKALEPKESEIQSAVIERIQWMQTAGEPIWFVRCPVGPMIIQRGNKKVLGTNPLRGVPDILLCAYGRFVGMEVKRPGMKPSEHQQEQIDGINAAGGLAGVVTSIEGAELMIAQAKKSNP